MVDLPQLPNLAAMGITGGPAPTAQQPTVVLGLPILKDVQLAPIMPLSAFNSNTNVNFYRERPPTGLWKIIADMGFTRNAINQGISQVNSNGNQLMASNTQQAAAMQGTAQVQQAPIDGGSWTNYVTSRGNGGIGLG